MYLGQIRNGDLFFVDIVYPLRDCFTTKGYAVPNNVYLAFNLLVVFATQHNATIRLSEPLHVYQIIKVRQVKLKIDTVMPSLTNFQHLRI